MNAMGNPRLVLIVTLEIRSEAAAAFERFETRAAAIMSRHGGRMERVIRAEGASQSGSSHEIHIVSFRDQADFDAYRCDPELAGFKSLREEVIMTTEIVRGYDRAVYGAALPD